MRRRGTATDRRRKKGPPPHAQGTAPGPRTARLRNRHEHAAQHESSDAAKLVEGMSLIHVYFKELEVLKYSKQENYAAIDLIGMTFLHITCT